MNNLKKFKNFSSDLSVNINNLCKSFSKKCQENFSKEELDNNYKIISQLGLKQLDKFKTYINLQDDEKFISKNSYDEIEYQSASNQKEVINLLDNYISARIFSNGKLHVTNLTPLKVKLKKITLEYECTIAELKKKLLKSYKQEFHKNLFDKMTDDEILNLSHDLKSGNLDKGMNINSFTNYNRGYRKRP